MPRSTPPAEQALPARAAMKRKAAERRELSAVRLRAEAAELDAEWEAFKAQESARRNVAEKASV